MLIIAVVAVRTFGKRIPKRIICMLWILVAIRLVVPVQIESRFSLVPAKEPITTENIVITQEGIIEENIESAADKKAVQSIDMISNDEATETSQPAESAKVTGQIECVTTAKDPGRMTRDLHIAACVWSVGVVIMLLYATVTYFSIKRKVSASVKIAPGVYECDDIPGSFIMGILSPKVYLSSELREDERKYILKHEFAHMSRYDYLWKPLGYAILSAYWFNPLCWISYILLCRDIEYACDEKVIRDIDNSEKTKYCRVLLENSLPRSMVAICPVAFGGKDVKNRIKNVVSYKKPTFRIIILSVLICITVGVCFATTRNVGVYQSDEKNVDKKIVELQKQIADLESQKNELQSRNAELNAIQKNLDSWDNIATLGNYEVRRRATDPNGEDRGNEDVSEIDTVVSDKDVMKLKEEFDSISENFEIISDEYYEKEAEYLGKLEHYSKVKKQKANELKKNTTPEIEDIITEYYETFNSGNIEGLSRFCKGDIDSKIVKARISAKYINKYCLHAIYTNPGPVEGSYVVYAYIKGKLRISGDDIPFVPEVEIFYVCRDEKGELYINCDTKDNEISDYISALNDNPAEEYIFEKSDEWKYRTEYMDVNDIIVKMREEVEAAS